jgi:signal transduction histidine kinase
VRTLKRGRSVPLAAEVALAFLAGAAAFALVAVAVSAADSDVVVVLLGVAYVAGVVAIAHYWGVAYAVPVALAGLLAYDWYYVPPIHPSEFPDSANLVELIVYLAIGVLVGELAAFAGRRADVYEAARSELAEEQAALRRVATLVARQPSPAQVFATVTEEVGRLLGVEDTRLIRYEPDGSATVVASWGRLAGAMPVGTRVSLEGDGVAGSPIVVEGRVWGAMIAASVAERSLPAGTESRIGEFTELVATAISNIQARSDLAASRARIAAAADEERRRVVRDLHDGAQQRLVHAVITLKLARRAVTRGDESAPALLDEALEQAKLATTELRELSHGILPAVLTHGGLRAGVEALAARMPVPVGVGVSVDRLPAAVEATAYFVVAEALTNVAKHAHARRAEVTARLEDGTLRVDVRDDGVGGAQPDGNGLLGLGDRLAVLDGRLRVESPAGGGTLVEAAIPVTLRG